MVTQDMVSKMSGIFLILFFIPTLVLSQSFTIVLDTTESMSYLINVIQNNLRTVVDAVRLEPHIEEFVLVPFNDPDVGVPIKSKSPEDFLRVVNAIKPSGGTDCPENSLAGIRKGLEISKPDSYIYVFTDAFAKDYNQVSAVKDLCRSTRSKVVIFLSGHCLSREGTIDIYKNISEYCSGVVFQLFPSNFREAFQLMKKMTIVEWNSVRSYSPVSDGFEFQVSVNSFTSNMMIVASGEQSAISVEDCMDCEDVMRDTKSFHVVNVRPHDGTYEGTLKCQTCLSLAVYKKLNLQFSYGFSLRRVNNIKETSLKPLPDKENYITIFLPTDSVSISSIELQSDGSSSELQMQQTDPGCYSATKYIYAEKRYRIIIHGYDSATSERLSGSTKVFEPQGTGFVPATMKPVIEIIKPGNTLVEHEATLTVPCRVTGYPKPDIWWEDGDQQKLDSEVTLLETPSVHMSYVTIAITSNITLYCKASNFDGEATESIDVFVNKTAVLEFVQEPKDETFEYGKEGKIFCEVNSYPKASIKWYHNDTILENTDNIQMQTEDNAVVIQKMGLDDVGEYKCEVTNAVETKSLTANIYISGLEYPELDTEESEIYIEEGEQTTINCRIVRGNPVPEVSWKFKSDLNDKFGEIPNEKDFNHRNKRGIWDYLSESSKKGVNDKTNSTLVKQNKPLKINVYKAGVYKCTGSNMLGEDSKDIIIKIKTPPKILNSEDEVISVKRGKRVELPCEVNANPSADVRWEISHGDVLVPLSGRHHIDTSNTLRFTALKMDSGNYHCIATNEFGTAKKSYTVNVLVIPYIEAPESKRVTASVGSTLTLACNLTDGNPEPSIIWEFSSSYSPPTTLSRGNSRNELVLENVTKSQEGNYTCVARNTVGFDTIKIMVEVY